MKILVAFTGRTYRNLFVQLFRHHSVLDIVRLHVLLDTEYRSFFINVSDRSDLKDRLDQIPGLPTGWTSVEPRPT